MRLKIMIPVLRIFLLVILLGGLLLYKAIGLCAPINKDRLVKCMQRERLGKSVQGQTLLFSWGFFYFISWDTHWLRVRMFNLFGIYCCSTTVEMNDFVFQKVSQ